MIINNIRKLRKEKKITMLELSQKAGIAEPTVRLAEREILRVKMDTLSKIATALEVRIKDLFDEM